MVRINECVLINNGGRCPKSNEKRQYCSFRKNQLCHYEVLINIEAGDLVKYPYYGILQQGVVIKTTPTKARVRFRNKTLKEVKEGWRNKSRLYLIKKKGQWTQADLKYPIPINDRFTNHEEMRNE